MKTQCPHCQAKFKAPDGSTGKKVKCPKCNGLFIITALDQDTIMEVCANCGKEMGKSEQAYVFNGDVVCDDCDKKLRRGTNDKEICIKCGRRIGPSEKAYIVDDNLVCVACDKKLTGLGRDEVVKDVEPEAISQKNQVNEEALSSQEQQVFPVKPQDKNPFQFFPNIEKKNPVLAGFLSTAVIFIMITVVGPFIKTCTEGGSSKSRTTAKQPTKSSTSTNRPKQYSGAKQPNSLHKAVEQNDIASVKSLIEKGANVNAPDQLGWSPLHFAAYQGHKQAAELLLNNGAIVDAKANNDVRPLHLAAEQGQTALAELLLAKGADVNARQVQGWTPLGLAAQNCHLETVKLLLDKGASVNSKSKSGLTPLHAAVSKGCRDVAELFLSRGAEVNAKSNNGRTPLHTAAYQNQQEIAKLLLSAGADPKVKDIEGKTPVDFANDFGNVTIAKLLAKTTESHPVVEQPKTSEDLPVDGVYSKDAGSGGSYKDLIHGFFEVEPPKGFKIVENRNKTTTTLDNGTVVPCSRISFQSDKARIAVVTRKTFKGTIEEDLKVMLYNFRSAGAEIITERFITIDGAKGAEVGSVAGGYRLLTVKYKKHGLDHAITMSCSPADFPSLQKEFTDFLCSYRSLEPK